MRSFVSYNMGLSFLFVVGGNGSHAGAAAIQDACDREGVCCCVIGVPKTIDNDMLLIDRTFGFQTAARWFRLYDIKLNLCAESARASTY